MQVAGAGALQYSEGAGRSLLAWSSCTCIYTQHGAVTALKALYSSECLCHSHEQPDLCACSLHESKPQLKLTCKLSPFAALSSQCSTSKTQQVGLPKKTPYEATLACQKVQRIFKSSSWN